MEETRRSPSGKALIVLFDSVSTSYPSGELVKSVSRFAAAHSDLPVIALLPEHYTAADVEIFKANLQVEFSVEGADAELSEKWAELLSVYGEGRMTGSIVMVNRGEVSWVSSLGEAKRALAGS